MKYFAVFLSMKDEELSRIHRQKHLDFLAQKRESGTVLMNGRFTDGTGGLIIYRAENEESAVSLVKQDPYISLGARDYEIREWDMETNYEF
ncbi:YciI-like protein [Jeotgalicoccus saudimassiliensis]|uniref:YciI-like protein n=1 Tax=Jeotgalicoccus saudimassiliensis TaxID=1461582 RepID=A0A078MCC8_9STAP|nr:YciI family protein [Jeotgalicoccus saudimassiliensis]CEA03077.1 YciI-like protein [Jeotgalicoccus saudimassiliensis]